THTEALLRQLTEAPRPLDDGRDDVPPELAVLVSRLLSHAPEERPQTMGEVSTTLRQVLEEIAAENSTAGALLEALQPADAAPDLDGPVARALLGKYELLAHLATGGMAEIHLARVRGAEGFEKLVVVKRVREDLQGNAHVVQQFLDEARLSASLQHPNIVQVY